MKKLLEKLNLKFLKKEAFSWIWVILVVVGFRTTFYEPFRIPTGSMIPTIMIGDFILVDKMVYGLKVPFTEFMETPIYLSKKKDPERNDVIVFKYPKNPQISYIKRVVGLPGDRIEMSGHKLIINGDEVNYNEVEDDVEANFLNELEEDFQRYLLEVKKESKTNHFIMLDVMSEEKEFSFVVPQDHFFVLGDNRDFSGDSRYWGFVPRDNIKGKAKFVWFSWRIPALGDTGDSSLLKLWRIGTIIK